MTNEEIREAIQTIAKRRRDRTCIDARGQYDTDYVDAVSTLADAYLAADEQQTERNATLERERDKLADLLREVLACGASYKGTGYAELQVPHWLIAKIRASVQDTEKGEA